MAQRGQIEARLAAGPALDLTPDYGPNGPLAEGRAELGRGVSGVTAGLTASPDLDHPFIMIDNPA